MKLGTQDCNKRRIERKAERESSIGSERKLAQPKNAVHVQEARIAQGSRGQSVAYSMIAFRRVRFAVIGDKSRTFNESTGSIQSIARCGHCHSVPQTDCRHADLDHEWRTQA